MRPSARPNKRSALLRGAVGFLLACTMIARSVVGVTAVPVASVSITVVGPDKKPIPGAVITVHVLGSEGRPVVPVKATVDQINRAFEPDLLVIPVGSTVEFPNSDSVSHQIYSFSPAKRFQLPLYRGTAYPPVRFDQAGVVTLGCNIHDEMLAYLVVTDAQYFGRTNASGTWTTEIPRGKYRISVWHPRMNDDASELDRELTVGDDDVHWTLRLAKSLRPAPLGPHPHSWDAY
ncbi:MAG TPA: methylamine utilization protein [Steroidobacteraceae bacterium]|jgi:plastocyanin